MELDLAELELTVLEKDEDFEVVDERDDEVVLAEVLVLLVDVDSLVLLCNVVLVTVDRVLFRDVLVLLLDVLEVGGDIA